MKSQRTFGRKAAEIEARREAGLKVGSTAGALTEERGDALEAIERCYRHKIPRRSLHFPGRSLNSPLTPLHLPQPTKAPARSSTTPQPRIRNDH
jgi:hypothetical protein